MALSYTHTFWCDYCDGVIIADVSRHDVRDLEGQEHTCPECGLVGKFQIDDDGQAEQCRWISYPKHNQPDKVQAMLDDDDNIEDEDEIPESVINPEPTSASALIAAHVARLQEVNRCLNPGLSQTSHFRRINQGAVEMIRVVTCRADAITRVLKSGDCQPYTDALEQLRKLYYAQLFLLEQVRDIQA